MANLKAKFYKYHRELGIIFSLPLALCAVTAMGMTIAREFLHNRPLAKFFFSLHTMSIFGSEEIENIYSIIVGISTLAIIFTGLMCLVSFKKKKSNQNQE
ncbi:MAG: hypothetical protein A2039_04470 [Candidatus Melainabacteria bacterium GWA2_34_9]|nr:MAG: hypothetical protein A2039_04470 [Candidatus Melainabacteria bacterium GWA2_34_9]